MKQIALSGQNGRGKHTLVDDEDYDWLSQYTWHISTSGYVKTGLFNKRTRKVSTLSMSRLIMGVKQRLHYVDHKDGNKLNNQRSNLRIATPSDNGKNITKSSSYFTSRFLGVSKAHKNKWRASVRIKTKNYCLGFFDTQEEAAMIRDRFVENLNNEFYRLNFPESA